MEGRLAAQDDAFDGSAEDDEEAYSPSHYLHDPSLDPAEITEIQDHSDSEQRKLRAAFSQLDDRAKEIVESRWLRDDKMTLHQLARRFGISAERVRQLEQNAIKKLRNQIQA
jgi:RNA polymerase sigma-32 factor